MLNGAKYFKKYVRSGEFPIPVVSNIYKRKYLLEHDLFFLKDVIHEDIEWVPRVFSMAGDVAFLNKTICYYRIREGSITNEQMLSKGSRSLDSLLIILARYVDDGFIRKYFKDKKRILFDRKAEGRESRGLLGGEGVVGVHIHADYRLLHASNSAPYHLCRVLLYYYLAFQY